MLGPEQGVAEASLLAPSPPLAATETSGAQAVLPGRIGQADPGSQTPVQQAVPCPDLRQTDSSQLGLHSCSFGKGGFGRGRTAIV